MAFRAARATLVFPRTEERPSLEEVGPVSVLNAMVEQRRQSQPPPPPLDLDLEDSPDESQVRTVVRAEPEKKSIGFIKIR